jgi:hypothetical protein
MNKFETKLTNTFTDWFVCTLIWIALGFVMWGMWGMF